MHGSERFLTLANSHFIQWDKAMDAGCKGPDGSPLIVTPDMKPLLRDGWGWKIIRAEAEKTWPNLPSFASMAMNSHNSNQIATNELECMMQLADLYQAGMKMDDAIMAVQASAPACKAYLQDVAYFCKMFGGGQHLPIAEVLGPFLHLGISVHCGLCFGFIFLFTWGHICTLFSAPTKQLRQDFRAQPACC